MFNLYNGQFFFRFRLINLEQNKFVAHKDVPKIYIFVVPKNEFTFIDIRVTHGHFLKIFQHFTIKERRFV